MIAIDAQGNAVANLQDPQGEYPVITSAVEVETEDFLYLGSLVAPVVARLPKEDAGL